MVRNLPVLQLACMLLCIPYTPRVLWRGHTAIRPARYGGVITRQRDSHEELAREASLFSRTHRTQLRFTSKSGYTGTYLCRLPQQVIRKTCLRRLHVLSQCCRVTLEPPDGSEPSIARPGTGREYGTLI